MEIRIINIAVIFILDRNWQSKRQVVETPFSLQSPLRIQNEDDSDVDDPDLPEPLQCCPRFQPLPRCPIWLWPHKRFQPLSELLGGQLPAKQPESEFQLWWRLPIWRIRRIR